MAEPPRATLRARRRLPLVWLVPIVAILAAGWLGYRAVLERGPLIAITLQNAEGLEVGKTKIKHRDIELGLVEAMQPSADLTSVTVQARMNRYAEAHLTTGTRFWVERPRLSAEGISGLGTLISGAFIEMEPGPGEPARNFVGLDDPPVVSADVPGSRYQLHARLLGSISQGAPVSFHGVKVGEVLGYQLSDEDGSATVQVFVRAPHDKLVHEGTRFWNASGLSVEVGSEGLKLQSESLTAILAGGVAFDVPPGGDAGPLAPPDSTFILYPDVARAKDALFTRRIPFLLHVDGTVDGLSVGAPVRMRGIQVGEVTDVHLEFDAASDRLTVPVTILLEPQRVRILHVDLTDRNFEARSYDTFRSFVARGLRARLSSGNLLTGQKIIALDFLPDLPPATLIMGGRYPEIPTVAADDLSSILLATRGLLADLDVTVTTLNRAITAPETRQAVRTLSSILANIDSLTHQADIEVGPLLAGLRRLQAQAEQTLKQTTATLAVTGAALAGDPETGGDLAGTLNELRQAAHSLHSLTDYLESHPEALLRGKTGGSSR